MRKRPASGDQKDTAAGKLDLPALALDAFDAKLREQRTMPAYDIVYVSLFSKNMFAQQTKPKLTLGVTKGSVCFDVDTEKKNSMLFILSYCIVFKRVFAREGNYTFKMLLTQVCHITEYFVHFFPLFFFHAVADSKRTMLSFKYFFRKLWPPSKQFL